MCGTIRTVSIFSGLPQGEAPKLYPEGYYQENTSSLG